MLFDLFSFPVQWFFRELSCILLWPCGPFLHSTVRGPGVFRLSVTNICCRKLCINARSSSSLEPSTRKHCSDTGPLHLGQHHSICRGPGCSVCHQHLFISAPIHRTLIFFRFSTCLYRTVLATNYLLHTDWAQNYPFQEVDVHACILSSIIQHTHTLSSH